MSLNAILGKAWRMAKADVRRQEQAQARAARENERIRRENEVTAAFNERWHRLNNIRAEVMRRFVDRLTQRALVEADASRLSIQLQEVNGWVLTIGNNIDSASPGDLSTYATCLRRLTVNALKLCKKYNVIYDIQTVAYMSFNKSVVVNGNAMYDFS